MFVTPLIKLVPFEAVAPALVVVGFMMVSQVGKIDWSDWGIGIPAFLTFTLMPFTYSIANGLGAGFIAFVLIRLFQGRAKEIHPLMWAVAGGIPAVLRHWHSGRAVRHQVVPTPSPTSSLGRGPSGA